MILRGAIAVLLVAAPVAASSGQRSGKLDRALQQALDAPSEVSQRVIITGTAACLAGIRAGLQAHGDRVSDLRSAGALTAIIHKQDAEAVAAQSCVRAVSSDAIVNGSALLPGGSVSGLTRNLRATLGLTSQSRKGFGLGVAVIDSGIAPLADFGTRLTRSYDFTTGGAVLMAPRDEYGHGTHVAGLIAGSGASGAGYQGVAPSARLIGLKVLDATGAGRTSDVIRAIDFATAHKADLGIDVINLSLGHPVYEVAATDPLVQAVERAVAAGIVVVASAGNAGQDPVSGLVGYSGISSPGNAPSAITVGAFKTGDTISRYDDRVANYSSRGPSWYDAFAKPDLVAPGTRLASLSTTSTTLYQKYETLRVGTNQLSLSGTSMAAAVTSGVVALVLEGSKLGLMTTCVGCPARPALTPNAVKAVLQYTALKLKNDEDIEYDTLTQGAGGLNAAGAVSLASTMDTRIGDGQPWLAMGVDPSTTIDGQVLPWAQNIVWGDNIVWGEGLILTFQAAWATNIVWGDRADDDIVWGNDTGANIVWGQNIVWGENIVWGQNIVWGENIVWGDGFIGMDLGGSNIVWGEGNIVWGDFSDSNIVWGDLFDANIVWGNTVSASVSEGR